MKDFYPVKTLEFSKANVFCGYSLVGPKEGEGKLGELFDKILTDDRCGKDTFEKGEREMFELALKGILSKAGLDINDVDAFLGGDLLNQIVSVAFAVRKFPKPFVGLYNACGTFVESLILGALLVENKMDKVVCLSGSHFSTAERQYRYPLELGVLRSPVSQWTATGVGCSVLSSGKEGCYATISKATMGRVIDYGIMDVNNMGAAMAPAAMDTLVNHLRNTNTSPKDYDLIVTGDLGKLGKEILIDLMSKKGYDISDNFADCGASLYYDDQKTYQGASGAACSAIVFNSQLLNSFETGALSRLLLIGTGALMSPTTSFQGESIPCIAHLVEVRRCL